uniref:Uncharacterized protein n=1 Tax=Strongyloides venezuelensis TaxID=75913 RepID=A0A0K0EWD3_STRVS
MIISKICVLLSIKYNNRTYDPEEGILVAQKIAEEFMFNHHSKRNMENIRFEHECNNPQRSLLLECLTYMNHDNVKRIEHSGSILKTCEC